MEKLSEITHQLDQQVARILRRFGGKVVDAPAPAKELVPREVKRRYRFALDDVRQLRDDCELVSEMVGETLARYDREQRERFQHIAAVLGACVLIPTLIASLFGVNFGVPGKENLSSFIAFVVAMFFLAGTGIFALLRAQKRDWHPRFWRDLAFPSGFAILIVAAFVAFLIWKS
jgi:Mg2+ and Co2+ transporter CorA